MQVPQLDGNIPTNMNMSAGGAMPVNSVATTNGVMPTNGNAPVVIEGKSNLGSVIKIIVIIVLSLALVTFIGLFIWKNSQYVEAQTDVDEKIAVAVAEAKDEQATKDEQEFAEREKYPYRAFSGPADYGQLTFKYPKTWSLYVANNAANGGNFEAYFNPIEVEAVRNDTVFALRLEILDETFESVVQRYQRDLDGGSLSLEVINVGGGTANKYTGTLPGTELSGCIVVFKIRDKTVVLRTDSVLFKDDFDRLLSTITFNA